MTREEHLLVIAAEECAELAQRLTKIARFGMTEVQPGDENPHKLTNRQRAIIEYNDLVAVLIMLGMNSMSDHAQDLKMEKVEKFLAYSKTQGTLTE